MTDNLPSDPLTGRLGRLAVVGIGADAVVHLYWLTGATWPFRDERSLSLAVLGYPVSFAARTLVPLVVVLLFAAGALWWRLRRGAGGFVGSVAHLTTVVVLAAVVVQLPVRVGWVLGFGSQHTGPVFYWLNLFGYLPVCVGLAVAAYRVAGVGKAHRGWGRRLALVLPLLLAAGIVTAAYGFAPGSEEYPGKPEARSRFLETDVARFHYVREGSGPPLVLLSAGTASTFMWEPQLDALAASRTVYVVDMPGQGYTEPKDADFVYDLPGMEKAIGSFLDAADLDRVDLGGHSWSGGWALSYAQSHPERVRSLVLAASSGLDVPDTFSWEILKTPVVGELMVNYGYTPDALRDSAANMFVHKELATPELVAAMWRPFTVGENLRSVYELERGLDWGRTQRRMPSTTTPTLVVWGDRDTILPSWQAARFAKLIPDAEAHVVDDCGHAITLDCPDETTALMKAFLS